MRRAFRGKDTMSAPILVTSRLRLRPWRDDDLTPFAALNADPRVMQHFPALLTRDESDRLAARIRNNMSTRAFGFWAIEVPGIADFIGFAGLSVPAFEAHFTPCVEIGWRVAFDHWGNGYATEAARAALTHAFATLLLDEVVAFTVAENRRSTRVMERIGLTKSPRDDFLHPSLPEDHPLRPHVLYRLTRTDWMSRRQT